MRKRADIEVRIDPSCEEPVIVIRTARRTREVEAIIRAIEDSLSAESPPIPGQRGGATYLLDQRDITRLYVEARKVRICSAGEVYESGRSLSYLEQQLDPERFMRISRFEIVNLREIESFDFSMAGTVYIRFGDGSVTWAARRYVGAIHRMLQRLSAGKGE